MTPATQARLIADAADKARTVALMLAVHEMNRNSTAALHADAPCDGRSQRDLLNSTSPQVW